jgi:hypothetical protein
MTKRGDEMDRESVRRSADKLPWTRDEIRF